jgi:copper(I)-binding protein
MTLLISRCAWSLAALLATTALAAGPSSASIAIVHAWSRATVPGASVGAAYFTILNSGPPDVLSAVESPVAKRVELHSMTINGGVMQMRPVSSLDIAANGRVVFGPQGLHVMLIDLRHPLREGDKVALTLVFRHAGRLAVEATVQGPGAMTPPATEAATNGKHH